MGFYPAALVGSQLLSNPVTVAQGGTGATSAGAALAGLGVSSIPWLAGDNGLLTANESTGPTPAGALLVAGTVYLQKLPIRSNITISNLWWSITAAGVGASTGSFGGLYSAAGTLLTGSSDIGGSLLAGGALEVALTTPQAFTAGAESTWPWAALLVNLATTQPTIARTSASGIPVNVNLSAANLRSATNGTGQTTLPASITPASNASFGNQLWTGAS